MELEDSKFSPFFFNAQTVRKVHSFQTEGQGPGLALILQNSSTPAPSIKERC